MAADPVRQTGDPQLRVAGARTAELFEQHGRMVYGLCRTLLRDPDDADDATQATFVSAHKAVLAGGTVRKPAAWLATIARNECGARAHARMREPLTLIDADLGHTRGPEAELDRKTVVAELRHAISELPDKQREAVVLRDLYGLHYDEVGAALDMSVASVESLLFRARRSLRVSLKPLASGALAVPLAVREGIAQALPGFTATGAAGGGATSGAVGLGLLAKFTGGPVALKVAAGVAAIGAAGSVAVGVEHTQESRPPTVQAHVQPHVHAQATGSVAAAKDTPAAGTPVIPLRSRSNAVAATVGGGADREGGKGRGSDDNRGAGGIATNAGSGDEGSGESRSASRGRDQESGESGSTGAHSRSGSGGENAAETDDVLGPKEASSGSDGAGRAAGSKEGSGDGETRIDGDEGESGPHTFGGSGESSDAEVPAVTTASES